MVAGMPTISRFYGITIQMFFKEHGVPHFHARYGGQIAGLTIESIERIRGQLPRRADRLVARPTVSLSLEGVSPETVEVRVGVLGGMGGWRWVW